jgi:hypothetical protein
MTDTLGIYWGCFKYRTKMASKTSKDEIFALLECYAAHINSYLPAFWKDLSVPSLRVQQYKKNFFFGYLILEDGTDRLSRNVGK